MMGMEKQKEETMIDFEEQWKEEFLRNYIASIEESNRETQPKASVGMLQAIKKRLKKKDKE